jgi:hypothetical protein
LTARSDSQAKPAQHPLGYATRADALARCDGNPNVVRISQLSDGTFAVVMSSGAVMGPAGRIAPRFILRQGAQSQSATQPPLTVSCKVSDEDRLLIASALGRERGALATDEDVGTWARAELAVALQELAREEP